MYFLRIRAYHIYQRVGIHIYSWCFIYKLGRGSRNIFISSAFLHYRATKEPRASWKGSTCFRSTYKSTVRKVVGIQFTVMLETVRSERTMQTKNPRQRRRRAFSLANWINFIFDELSRAISSAIDTFGRPFRKGTVVWTLPRNSRETL